MKNLLLTCVFAMILTAGAPLSAGDATHDGHAMPGAGGGERWSSIDDAAFLFGMIEHHKGALDMARAVRNSQDREVAEWAGDILEDQQEEITLMESIVRERNLSDPGHGAAMRADMQAMTRSPASDNADVNFVVMMVPHHASAIDMSLPALVESQDKRIRKLARDIIDAQAEEIYEFREWLDRRGRQ